IYLPVKMVLALGGVVMTLEVSEVIFAVGPFSTDRQREDTVQEPLPDIFIVRAVPPDGIKAVRDLEFVIDDIPREQRGIGGVPPAIAADVDHQVLHLFFVQRAERTPEEFPEPVAVLERVQRHKGRSPRAVGLQVARKEFLPPSPRLSPRPVPL